ncbi:MAG: hypothetical protein GVY10_02650 [Verrucomicrobia bacterium]|jgi:galactokinase|nr:hypothetical protein [Verrucomicrobiota bacterium]
MPGIDLVGQRDGIIAKGSASGRLDCLGGIAGFGGCLVLTTPLREVVEVTITPTPERSFEVWSENEWIGGYDAHQTPALLENQISDQALVRLLREDRKSDIFTTQMCCLKVMLRASRHRLREGLRVHIRSNLPEKSGFSFIPALQIASLKAYGTFFRHEFRRTEIAHWSHVIEDLNLEANGSLSDHLSCAFGERGFLLPILCRPDHLLPPVELPPELAFCAVSSGLPYESNNPSYVRFRTASFMGKFLFERALDHSFVYGTQIAFAYLTHDAFAHLPLEMEGGEFPGGEEDLNDPYSKIHDGTTYQVRDSLRFPILENRRSERFLELLIEEKSSEHLAPALGQILRQSQQDMEALRLPHPRALEIVRFLEQQGTALGIHGARVSCHGSTGPVVALVQRSSLPAIEEACHAQFPDSHWIVTV